jgi:predicted dehydrogenase
MTKLRAGIAGLGVMGNHHARVLSNLDGVELVGIADPSSKQKGKIPEHIFFESVEELISKRIDYCIVSAPTNLHEELSIRLIESGIHVLIEKPIAHNLTSGMNILLAAQKHGVIGAVGHIERYNSAVQQVRKRIQNGDLGSIYQIATRRQGPFPMRITDVGVVKDLATHDIDLTSWVTGKKYLEVSAHAAFQTGRSYEDLVSVSALLEGSIVASHLVNWLSPLKERKTIITGEKGTFVIDTLRSDLTYYENGTLPVKQREIAHFKGVTQGDVRIFAFDKPEPLLLEHENFRDAVLGKNSEIVTLKEGLETLKVAEAVIKSYKNLESCKL